MKTAEELIAFIRTPSDRFLATCVRQGLALRRHKDRLKPIQYYRPNLETVAVVCAAGPSLSDPATRELIIRHRKHMTVYCADTALPPMIDLGIVPDVVVHLDPEGFLVRNSFACVRKVMSAKPLLFVPSYCHTDVLDAWGPAGPIFVYNALDERNRYYEEVRAMWPNVGGLSSKANVGFFAVNAAIELGHPAVAWIGLDFGHREERAYAAGVNHDCQARVDDSGYLLLDRDYHPLRATISYGAQMLSFVEHHECLWKHHVETFDLSAGILPFHDGHDDLARWCEEKSTKK